jgi:predicted SAM-dependent methyltransferase
MDTIDWRDRPDIKRHIDTFVSWVDFKSKFGLEIGPFDKPLVDRSTARVHYIDYFDVENLRKKAIKNANRNENNVVELDYVLKGRQISEVVTNKYDYVVASHVLEHIPNLFGWLRDITLVLNPGGLIFAIVPDCRYTFDLCRPKTSIGELLENHFMKRVKPSQKNAFDQRFYHRHVSSHNLWKNYAEHLSNSIATFSTSQAYENFNKSKNEYIDCHCNLFDPLSFRESIEISKEIGIHGFSIKKIKETCRPFLDFIALLEIDS